MIGRAVDFMSQLGPWLLKGGAVWVGASLVGATLWTFWRIPARRAERAAELADIQRRNREAADQLASHPNLSPDVAAILEQLDRRYYDREFTRIIRAEAIRQHPSNRRPKP